MEQFKVAVGDTISPKRDLTMKSIDKKVYAIKGKTYPVWEVSESGYAVYIDELGFECHVSPTYLKNNYTLTPKP